MIYTCGYMHICYLVETASPTARYTNYENLTLKIHIIEKKLTNFNFFSQSEKKHKHHAYTYLWLLTIVNVKPCYAILSIKYQQQIRLFGYDFHFKS